MHENREEEKKKEEEEEEATQKECETRAEECAFSGRFLCSSSFSRSCHVSGPTYFF